MPEAIRTFIAIALPATVTLFLGQVQQEFKALGIGARWVKPENIHLTLKFLGNTDPGRIDSIRVAMADAARGVGPFTLAAKGLGVFPGIKRPRVIWIGLAGQTQVLFDLQRRLDDNLVAIGVPKEKRPFKGHLTLGRFRESVDAAKIGRVISEYAELRSNDFATGQMTLYKSDLKPSGPVYSRLQQVVF